MRNVCKIILACVLIVVSIAALGCNTLEGMGRDIEQAGAAIQDAVD